MNRLKKNYMVTFVILTVTTSTTLYAQTAPDFKLKDIDGREFHLKKALENGPVLIDFWATWCAPCIRSIPHLQKIAEELSPKGLTVITVNEDGPRSMAKIRLFLKSHNISLRVLLDLNSSVMHSYRTNGLPSTVLVNGDGEIVYFKRGYSPGDEITLRKEIHKLLNK